MRRETLAGEFGATRLFADQAPGPQSVTHTTYANTLY